MQKSLLTAPLAEFAARINAGKVFRQTSPAKRSRRKPSPALFSEAGKRLLHLRMARERHAVSLALADGSMQALHHQCRLLQASQADVLAYLQDQSLHAALVSYQQHLQHQLAVLRNVLAAPFVKSVPITDKAHKDRAYVRWWHSVLRQQSLQQRTEHKAQALANKQARKAARAEKVKPVVDATKRRRTSTGNELRLVVNNVPAQMLAPEVAAAYLEQQRPKFLEELSPLPPKRQHARGNKRIKGKAYTPPHEQRGFEPRWGVRKHLGAAAISAMTLAEIYGWDKSVQAVA